ncbi:MAG: hypothetical protein KAH91_06205, partial [Thermoplasmatales archaeon]|nr:hypothetical protein [Thermoplasmatales archaeon]
MYNDADQYWNTPNFEFRKHIFFNIWNNGSSNVELKRHVCKTCGFVIDLPRPSIEDVSKKYQYLDSVREDMETTHNISEKSMKKEYKQSLEILNLVEPVLNNKFLDILDYGGGDGHMLIPMEKMGHKCYLVDYNKSP